MLLQPEDVSGFALVVLAPDFRVVLNVGEVGTDLDGVAVLHDSACKQGVHGEVFSHLLEVHVFVLVAEDGVARFHLEVGHAGEAGDQRFGEPVAEEIGVRVAARVGERQHRDGSDLRRACLGAPEPCPRRRCDHQGRRSCDPIFPGRDFWRNGRQCRHGFPRFGVALQPLQIRAHVGCVLVAQIAIFLQSFVDDLVQLGRHFGIQPNGGSGRPVQDGFENRCRAVATEGSLAGGHLIENGSE